MITIVELDFLKLGLVQTFRSTYRDLNQSDLNQSNLRKLLRYDTRYH